MLCLAISSLTLRVGMANRGLDLLNEKRAPKGAPGAFSKSDIMSSPIPRNGRFSRSLRCSFHRGAFSNSPAYAHDAGFAGEPDASAWGGMNWVSREGAKARRKGVRNAMRRSGGQKSRNSISILRVFAPSREKPHSSRFKHNRASFARVGFCTFFWARLCERVQKWILLTVASGESHWPLGA